MQLNQFSKLLQLKTFGLKTIQLKTLALKTLHARDKYFLLFLLLFFMSYTTPGLDMWVSGLFYRPETNNWIGYDKSWVQAVYWSFRYSGPFYLMCLLSLIIFARLNNDKDQFRKVLYASLVLIVGILVVEELLKNNWGRARPRDILEFGGSLAFTEFWQKSSECAKNCSFTSGHSAAGFYLLILVYLFKSNWWFLPGLFFGLLLSYTRVSMGGHFLSDVLMSGIIMYILAWSLSFMLIAPKSRDKTKVMSLVTTRASF